MESNTSPLQALVRAIAVEVVQQILADPDLLLLQLGRKILQQAECECMIIDIADDAGFVRKSEVEGLISEELCGLDLSADIARELECRDYVDTDSFRDMLADALSDASISL